MAGPDSSENESRISSSSEGNDVVTAIPSNRQWKQKFRMRPEEDDEDQDWWFASTAIPLLVSTHQMLVVSIVLLS